MRFKTKKQQKEHVSGYGLWEDFNCFTLRVSSISVTEKNILLKHATEKSNVRIISGKTKLAETMIFQTKHLHFVLLFLG